MCVVCSIITIMKPACTVTMTPLSRLMYLLTKMGKYYDRCACMYVCGLRFPHYSNPLSTSQEGVSASTSTSGTTAKGNECLFYCA